MACIHDRVVRDVVSLGASATCAEAAQVMAKQGIGCVGVRRGDKLVGIVADRDVVSVIASGGDASCTPLAVAMRPDMPAISTQATDGECAELMRQRRTRHLLVMEDGEIVGIISMLDLVEVIVEEKLWIIDHLESYIGGGRNRQLTQPIVAAFRHPRAAS